MVRDSALSALSNNPAYRPSISSATKILSSELNFSPGPCHSEGLFLSDIALCVPCRCAELTGFARDRLVSTTTPSQVNSIFISHVPEGGAVGVLLPRFGTALEDEQ
jgi:hypothetical protein